MRDGVTMETVYHYPGKDGVAREMHVVLVPAAYVAIVTKGMWPPGNNSLLGTATPAFTSLRWT